MPRQSFRPLADRQVDLRVHRRECAGCGGALRASNKAYRVVTTLEGSVRLGVQIRRCTNTECERRGRPVRAEEEGSWVLPSHEFGLDVIALVGTLRHAQHRSVPEIHDQLQRRGVPVCERTVSNLLDRYDELLALSLTDPERLARIASNVGRVVLAIDGLQPDVGNEVLWVLRDVLSGEILLARSLLSSTEEDLGRLLGEVKTTLGDGFPIAGVVSDGQASIRNAVATALPGVPHQLCHFHYLREAARPIYELDRHAKFQLKKQVRGVRPIERELEGCEGIEARAARAYCAAVRSSLTDDGRPPLEASGLKLQERLQTVASSLDRVALKKGCRNR